MAIFHGMTIREIAEAANVSIATVSRAINGTGQVKESTLQKIQAVMADGNHHSLRSPKKLPTHLILVSLPDLVNPFYYEIYKGIAESCALHGYRAIYYANQNYSQPSGFDFLENSDFYDGLIILHTMSDQQRLVRLASRKPVIMCSEHISNAPIPYVAIDDYAAARSAVNYLISTGKRKIALVNSLTNNNYAFHRERAFRDCMEEYGIPVCEKMILHLPQIDFETAFGSVPQLFSGNKQPDAVFCISDIFAAAVIKFALANNLRVPEDLSVMGFDDTSMCLTVTPSISTVHQPAIQMGLQACNLLIQTIESPHNTPERVILSTDLIIRGSA